MDKGREGIPTSTPHHEASSTVIAQRLAAIVEGSDDAIISKTLDGTVTSWNPAAEVMFGYSAAEMIGRPMTTIFPADRLDEEERILGLIAEGQRVDHFETCRRHRDGRIVHVSVTISPIRDETGRVVGASKIARDISHRMQAEQALRNRKDELEQQVSARTAEIEEARAHLAVALRKAESAHEAKAAFLANMSHEIRTPMNAIVGLTYLLLRDAQDKQLRDRLGKIDGAAKHLLQVINDVLDLSKIGASKMTLESIDFVVDDMFARAFDLITNAAREKGLELVLDTDHLPTRLRGDPTRLKQMLVNLLSNAVKFTDRGWVKLTAEVLDLDSTGRSHIRFEVQDTGMGIPLHQQSALFSAFQQADVRTTRLHGGTGLGLALTRHLSNLMGGEIGVDSAPGKGSRFWFTARFEQASPWQDAPFPVQLKGLNALVIDDLPEALSVISDRVRILGLRVDPVLSGLEALRKVEQLKNSGDRYDVVLVDWKMEPLDGIDTLKRMRESLGATMPPAILVTAFDESAARQQAQSIGCDTVLIKPLTASMLHDGLAGALSRSTRMSPALMSDVRQGEDRLRERYAGSRILVAEDNPISQEVAVALLAAAGLVVTIADDGAQAVEMALSGAFDLILMDVQMPVMDGLSATRAIRLQLGEGVPIVAMTADAFGEDVSACLASGMNDFLTKPVDVPKLHACLLKWLAKDGVC